MEVDTELRKVISEKKAVEDHLVETLEKIQAKDELVNALQDKSANINIVMNWHKKMADYQLSELKLQRQVSHVKQSEAMALKELEEVNNRSAALEVDLVNLQSTFDQTHVEWEYRELELELKLQQYEEEREKIFQTASMAELKEAMPDRTLPIPQQLEVSLRLLVERTRLLTAQEIKISSLETKVKDYKAQIETMEHEGLDKEFKLNNLQQANVRLNLESGKIMDETEQKYRDMARKREADAMLAAQGMIASLRRQLSQKADMLEKYQKMICEMRGKMGKLSEADRLEIEQLATTVNALSDQQVGRLRISHETPRAESHKRDSDPENVISELENLLKIKVFEILDIQGKSIECSSREIE